MKLAINGQQLSQKHTLPEALDVLTKFGVSNIELWPSNVGPKEGVTFTTPEEHERWENRDIEGTAALIKSRGFTVACVTLGFWAAPVCFANGGEKAFTAALCEAVDAAHQLGAGIVNCYSTGIPLRLFTAAVRPAAEYAAKHGVVITLENEAHDESGIPASVCKAGEAINSPGFGTQYDPCNYYHAYIEPYPLAYDAIQPHISYVHLKGGCHYRPDVANMHRGSLMRDSEKEHIGYVPLPEAAFPIEAIVQRLKRDGYTGFVTLEPHVPADALLDFYAIEIPYLKGLLEGK
jgi:sugar phosphate isomerase/epimerase